MNGIAGYSSTRKTKRKPVQQTSFKPAAQPVSPSGFKPTAAQAGTFANVTAGSQLLTDPGYLAATDAAQKTHGLADAQYDFSTNQARSDYGFDANGGIDPNNPYSRAALLQETYRRGRAGNTNSYAAQGQLYSGALQTAQDESTRQYSIGSDQLAKGYQGAVGQANLDKLSAYGQADANTAAAVAAALTRLLGKTT